MAEAAALGTQYREGRGGVPRDAAEAARWFAVAAENGVREAQHNLGLMHYRGEGVPRQFHEALRWMRQAAANGHVPAQRALDQLCLTGLDTMGQDSQEARTWLASAASQGNRESQRLLTDLDRAMPADRDCVRRFRQLSPYGWVLGLRPVRRLPVAALRTSRPLRVVLTAHRLLRFQVTVM